MGLLSSVRPSISSFASVASLTVSKLMKAKPRLRPVVLSMTTWHRSIRPNLLKCVSSSLSLVSQDNPNTPRHLLGSAAGLSPPRPLLECGGGDLSSLYRALDLSELSDLPLGDLDLILGESERCLERAPEPVLWALLSPRSLTLGGGGERDSDEDLSGLPSIDKNKNFYSEKYRIEFKETDLSQQCLNLQIILICIMCPF